jgi:DNA-binding MarR family transcriptional regulator
VTAVAKRGSEADKIWHTLVSVVMDSRDDWRRKVSDATGLPFSRVRVLRRLLDAPLTLSQLADVTGSDAPATTVAVNDLEHRGLVERYPHPDNRRAKLVSLTPAGRHIVELARRTVYADAPPAMQQLSKTDLGHLSRILKRINTAEH